MSDAKTTSPEYSAVAATLGMKDNYEVKDVMSRISELLAVEARLTNTERLLSDTQTVIVGNETAIKNLQTNVNELTASLKGYQDNESLEKKTRISNMVSQARDAGKIDDAAMPVWIEMAEANETLTGGILNSIPAREKITKEIATDPANIQAAAEAAKSAEQKLAEQVNAAVGEKFEFKKFKRQ